MSAVELGVFAALAEGRLDGGASSLASPNTASATSSTHSLQGRGA
jgi:hypothetical protein